jgi:hypothetical protein
VKRHRRCHRVPANSPRRSTKSTRVYAAPTKAVARSVRSCLVADCKAYRRHLRKALHLGAAERSVPEQPRSAAPELTVTGKSPEHLKPPPTVSGARAEPLVRQCLPRRVVRHSFLARPPTATRRSTPLPREKSRPPGAPDDRRRHARARCSMRQRSAGRIEAGAVTSSTACRRARASAMVSATVGSVQKRSTSPVRVTHRGYRLGNR